MCRFPQSLELAAKPQDTSAAIYNCRITANLRALWLPASAERLIELH